MINHIQSNEPQKARIMFMGSPPYAATILKALYREQYNIVAVISQPDKRVGRGKKMQSPQVKRIADELGLNTFQPTNLNTTDFYEFLQSVDPELIIVAAYGKILRKNILEYPKLGCVNVHASLLPRWRGASPINAAILHGDEKSGVTIMKMDAGIDTGDILSTREIELKHNETVESLTEDLAKIGAELLLETLPGYMAGQIIPQKQSDSGSTYAGIIKKNDGLIDFNMSAVEIDRMVRAYNPWPSAFFEWQGRNLKIFKIQILDSKQLTPGERGVIDKYPCVGTGTQDIQLVEVQLPGKNRIDGKMFLNGARNWQC